MKELKFYEKEANIFYKEDHIYIPYDKIDLICKKLSKHFKFKYEGCKFRRMTIYGITYHYTITFERTINISLLILCHELAHVWNHNQNLRGHDKKLMIKIRRLIKYANKNLTKWLSSTNTNHKLLNT